MKPETKPFELNPAMPVENGNAWLRNQVRAHEIPLYACLGVLAAFYLVLVLAFSPDQLKNDEPRYFTGANNLTKGYFVAPDTPDFTNGPGFPLILTPVMSLLGFEFDGLVQDPANYEYFVPGASGNYLPDLKWPLLPLRLLNVLFLTAGAFVIYRASRLIVSRKAALLIAVAISLNPLQLRWVPLMMTENVTPLLFGSFAWAYIKGLQHGRFSWKWTLLAGLAFCVLALTRTMFGYVALGALISIPVFCFLDGHVRLLKQAAAPFAVALLGCLPYLAYTHHHTGKLFCWATNGPELLYWITSPHEGEYGSWLQEKWVIDDPVLAKNHLTYLQSVAKLPIAERADAWMEGVRKNLEAENIKSALVRNYAANLCRVFFNVPRSRKYENFPKLVWTLTGSLFAGLIFLALIPTLYGWRKLRVELKLLLLCVGIYFCGVILLPAEPRYLIPVFPVIFLWLAYVCEQLVEIRVKLQPSTDEPR